jgi:hypothetical protein
MGEEDLTTQWRIRAMTLLHRVTGAQRRLQASMQINEITMLAAADELHAATRDVTAWMAANPCPDLQLGIHVTRMLDTCADVASTAQRAAGGPADDMESVMGRLGGLLAVIDFDSKALEAW